MEKPEAAKAVTFLWNDVAVIADDNCSFIVCKSLVKLPNELPEIDTIEKIEAYNVAQRFLSSPESGTEIDGEVLMQLSYATATEETAQAAFVLPFRGSYDGSQERSSKPQVVYLDGQSVGWNHLLLETVLALPNTSQMQRAEQKIAARFQQEQRLDLPDNWPDWAQLIGAQVHYVLQDVKQQEDTLELSGNMYIRLLYAANQPQGEKVCYYPLTQPFRMQLSSEQAITDADALEMRYQVLTAHLLSGRQAVVNVQGVVQVVPSDSADNAVDTESVANRQLDEAESVEQTPTNDTIKKNAPAARPITNRNRRPSRRDAMLKHMRTLDRGVRTPQCSRNIALTAEDRATQTNE